MTKAQFFGWDRTPPVPPFTPLAQAATMVIGTGALVSSGTTGFPTTTLTASGAGYRAYDRVIEPPGGLILGIHQNEIYTSAGGAPFTSSHTLVSCGAAETGISGLYSVDTNSGPVICALYRSSVAFSMGVAKSTDDGASWTSFLRSGLSAALSTIPGNAVAWRQKLVWANLGRINVYNPATDTVIQTALPPGVSGGATSDHGRVINVQNRLFFVVRGASSQMQVFEYYAGGWLLRVSLGTTDAAGTSRIGVHQPQEAGGFYVIWPSNQAASPFGATNFGLREHLITVPFTGTVTSSEVTGSTVPVAIRWGNVVGTAAAYSVDTYRHTYSPALILPGTTIVAQSLSQVALRTVYSHQGPAGLWTDDFAGPINENVATPSEDWGTIERDSNPVATDDRVKMTSRRQLSPTLWEISFRIFTNSARINAEAEIYFDAFGRLPGTSTGTLNHGPITGTAFVSGETITGGSSGATARVNFVVDGLRTQIDTIVGTFVGGETLTGSIGGGTAVLNLQHGPVTGTYSVSETITGSISGATATLDAISTGDGNFQADQKYQNWLQVSSTTGTFQVGETLTGGTSGATSVLRGIANGSRCNLTSVSGGTQPATLSGDRVQNIDTDTVAMGGGSEITVQWDTSEDELIANQVASLIIDVLPP